MATRRRVRQYQVPYGEDMADLERMMNGTHRNSQYNKQWQIGSNERIAAVVYHDIKGWIVFTDEIVMGPP